MLEIQISFVFNAKIYPTVVDIALSVLFFFLIASNNQQELSCARQVGCTNSTILTEANIAIGDRNFICSNLGRQGGF